MRPDGHSETLRRECSLEHAELKKAAETRKGALAACVRGRRYLDTGRTRADPQVLREAPRGDDALLRSHRPCDRTGLAIAPALRSHRPCDRTGSCRTPAGGCWRV